MKRSLLGLGIAGALAVAVSSATAATPNGKAQLGSFGVDLTARDLAVKPGDDFNRYASGQWIDTYVLKDYETNYGSFNQLRDRAEEQTRALMRGAAGQQGPRAGQQRPQAARFLRQLHGPRRPRCRRHQAAAAGAGPDRADRLEGQADRRLRQCRHRRQQRAVRDGRGHRPQGPEPVPGGPGRGRPGPAGPRLLPQPGRALRQDPRSLPRAHPAHAGFRRRRRWRRQGPRRSGAGAGNRAGQAAVGAGQAARPRQDLQPVHLRRAAAEVPGLRLGRAAARAGTAAARQAQHHHPGRDPAGDRDRQRHPAGDLARLPGLPCRRRQRRPAEQRDRRRFVRVQRQGAGRAEGPARGLEARAGLGGRSWRPGRGAGRTVRGALLQAGSEGGDGPAGREPAQARCAATSSRSTGWARRPRPRPTASWPAFRPKIGYPSKWKDYSSVAIKADDLLAQRGGDARVQPRRPEPPRRPEDRPRRMGHDPADGERLLQLGVQRDRVPGGDPAAAVLRRERRPGRELRRHRRRDRPRDGPRLRRPGQQVRRRRHPAQLVDRRGPRPVRAADQGAGRAVRRLLPAGRPVRQRRADHGREHRRPRRPVDGLHRLPAEPRRQARAGDRRPDRRPALLPGLGAGVEEQVPRRGPAATCSRPTRTRPACTASTARCATSTPGTRRST